MLLLLLLSGEGDLKQLLQGKGVSLSSQFRLTYSMMLNLLRVEDLKVKKLGCKPVNL
jgi:antiviral helicase SKI2